MDASIIAFPNLVTGGIQEGVKIDANEALERMLNAESGSSYEDEVPALDALDGPKEDAAVDGEDDPAKALEAEMKADKK